MFTIAVSGFAGIGAAGVHLVRSWRERPTDECRGHHVGMASGTGTVPTLADIANIKARHNIVDVVSVHVALQRSGRSYRGCCPFHAADDTHILRVPGSTKLAVLQSLLKW